MSERDELVEVVWQASAKPDARTGRLLFLGAYDTARIADVILAAGYHKPRTITTAEELDALPDDSVILDSMDGPLIKVGSWWHSPTDEMKSHNVLLPAPVLHEGALP